MDKNLLILAAQNMIIMAAHDGWQQDSNLVLQSIDFLSTTFALEAMKNAMELDRLNAQHYTNLRRN